MSNWWKENMSPKQRAAADRAARKLADAGVNYMIALFPKNLDAGESMVATNLPPEKVTELMGLATEPNNVPKVHLI